MPTDCRAGGEPDARAARLRKLIARKRSEKRRLERDIEACRADIAELDALRRRRLHPIDDQLHEHFRFALQCAELAARRAEIRSLYADLMMTGTISTQPLSDENPSVEPVEHECSCPFCSGQAQREDTGTARVHVPRDETKARPMRDLYRDLASRYHPDKAHDDATRVEHERLMREINGAYAAGDLDSLAALSHELGFDVTGDGVLEALAIQYERLKTEIRAMRRDGLGALVVETRRCRRRDEPPPLESIARDLHSHADLLDRLAAVFREFRAGGTSEMDFLLELLGEPYDDDDDIIADEELFLAVASLFEQRDRRPSGSGATTQKRRKRKQQRKARQKSCRRRKR